jgi:hypothetical protein
MEPRSIGPTKAGAEVKGPAAPTTGQLSGRTYSTESNAGPSSPRVEAVAVEAFAELDLARHQTKEKTVVWPTDHPEEVSAAGPSKEVEDAGAARVKEQERYKTFIAERARAAQDLAQPLPEIVARNLLVDRRETTVHSMQTLAALTLAAAHPVETTDALLPNGPEQFKKLCSALLEVKKEALLAEPSERGDLFKLCQSMQALMDKGFRGGIGCFVEFGQAPAGMSTKPDISDRLIQQDELAKFGDMVEWYRERAEAHFQSPPRDRLGVELAQVQLLGTVGQIMQDTLEDRGVSQTAKDVARQALDSIGMLPPAETYGRVNELRALMRSNPLLSECKNETVRDDITKALTEGPAKERLRGVLSSVCSSAPDELRTTLVDTLEHAYTATVQVLARSAVSPVSGHRGRMPIPQKSTHPLKDLDILGSERSQKAAPGMVIDSFAAMPDRRDDALAMQEVERVFGEPDDLGITRLKEAFDTQKILASGFAPKVVLQLGSGLAGPIGALYTRPTEAFEIALLAAIDSEKKRIAESGVGPEHGSEILTALQEIRLSLLQPANAQTLHQSLRESLRDIPIHYNGATPSATETLGTLAETPSVAGIMRENHLRTLCSISGTTVDAICGAMLTGDPESVKEALAQLLEEEKAIAASGLIAQEAEERGLARLPNAAQDESDRIERRSIDWSAVQAKRTPKQQEAWVKFQKFFTSIATFMQSGQYHTAAEVLGGLFIGALSSHEGDNQDFRDVTRRFENLMIALSDDPSRFFALNPEDRSAIQGEKMKEACATVLKEDAERVRHR